MVLARTNVHESTHLQKSTHSQRSESMRHSLNWASGSKMFAVANMRVLRRGPRNSQLNYTLSWASGLPERWYDRRQPSGATANPSENVALRPGAIALRDSHVPAFSAMMCPTGMRPAQDCCCVLNLDRHGSCSTSRSNNHESVLNYVYFIMHYGTFEPAGAPGTEIEEE